MEWSSCLDETSSGDVPPQPLCCLTTSAASVTAVPPSAKPSIRPRATLSKPHPTTTRPNPRNTPLDSPHKTPPPPRRDPTKYRYRICNLRGHSERWSKCPSKLAAAATISTDPRGPALSSKQESLPQITPGTPRGLAPPDPPSALSDTNSLPVPLASIGQCQASPISAGSSVSTLLPVPGLELVPAPDPETDPDPPTGDPPNLTAMIISQCEPLTTDVSSPHTLPPAEDNPLAGLGITSLLVDQELSGQDTDTGSIPTTVVEAAGVGGQPCSY
ncbi:uncharacterized protein [Macrobrachium rosenbergii]|uniref:uncharacterized protein n=1 Tax=Macrobrachium rosenbergii TaxID=79674 RepID=UPI0034D3E010